MARKDLCFCQPELWHVSNQPCVEFASTKQKPPEEAVFVITVYGFKTPGRLRLGNQLVFSRYWLGNFNFNFEAIFQAVVIGQ